MLYLFGRLALSDFYYFNDDFYADDRPEKQARAPRRQAAADSRPAAVALHGETPPSPQKSPPLNSSGGLFSG